MVIIKKNREQSESGAVPISLRGRYIRLRDKFNGD